MEGPKGFLSAWYGIAALSETVFSGELIGVHSCPFVVGLWLPVDLGHVITIDDGE